jgi:hypothetical protein
MAFFTAIERTLVESISGLVYCNPFLPIRIDLERTLLAGEFEHAEPVWSGGTLNPAERANVIRLQSIAEALCQSMLQRIEQGTKPTGKEALLYEDLVLYVLYYRHHPTFR